VAYNISVEEAIPPPTKKLIKGPTNKWLKVVGGPEGADIQILFEDSLNKKQIFSESEAVEVTQQFLKEHTDLQPIGMMPKKINSRYALYKVGGKPTYVFIAWNYGKNILILLPKNNDMKSIRTTNPYEIPSFPWFNPCPR